MCSQDPLKASQGVLVSKEIVAGPTAKVCTDGRRAYRIDVTETAQSPEREPSKTISHARVTRALASENRQATSQRQMCEKHEQLQPKQIATQSTTARISGEVVVHASRDRGTTRDACQWLPRAQQLRQTRAAAATSATDLLCTDGALNLQSCCQRPQQSYFQLL